MQGDVPVRHDREAVAAARAAPPARPAPPDRPGSGSRPAARRARGRPAARPAAGDDRGAAPAQRGEAPGVDRVVVLGAVQRDLGAERPPGVGELDARPRARASSSTRCGAGSSSSTSVPIASSRSALDVREANSLCRACSTPHATQCQVRELRAERPSAARRCTPSDGHPPRPPAPRQPPAGPHEQREEHGLEARQRHQRLRRHRVGQRQRDRRQRIGPVGGRQAPQRARPARRAPAAGRRAASGCSARPRRGSPPRGREVHRRRAGRAASWRTPSKAATAPSHSPANGPANERNHSACAWNGASASPPRSASSAQNAAMPGGHERQPGELARPPVALLPPQQPERHHEHEPGAARRRRRGRRARPPTPSARSAPRRPRRPTAAGTGPPRTRPRRRTTSGTAPAPTPSSARPPGPTPAR